MKGNKSPWSIVPQFFWNVIRSLMASPPKVEGLFTPMQSPHPIILLVDSWPAMLNIDAANASHCLVEEVVHYKRSRGKEHEFLCFRVSDATGSWKAFVFADRTVNMSDEDIAPSLSNKTPVLSNPSPSSFPSSTHCSPVLPTYDSIYAATESSAALGLLHADFFRDGHKAERTLAFDAHSARPSVVELASLLKVTSHHHAASYTLCKNQCYWFAATVYESLQQLFPRHRETIHSNKNGTYRRLEISMPNSAEDVCAAYHRERAAILARENEERERYEAVLRAAREEAREEGREEGRVEGREEGRAEERAAHQNKRAELAAREQEVLKLAERIAPQSRSAAAN
ncbi:hypothetical protein BU15DRAFT_78801 [Melanogaster broomeanus]|nr:hypothetical protein BU15DRAFT_78801 [Melanogaster broomeanus]